MGSEGGNKRREREVCVSTCPLGGVAKVYNLRDPHLGIISLAYAETAQTNLESPSSLKSVPQTVIVLGDTENDRRFHVSLLRQKGKDHYCS